MRFLVRKIAIRRIASLGRADDTKNDGIPLGMPLLVLPKDAFLAECDVGGYGFSTKRHSRYGMFASLFIRSLHVVALPAFILSAYAAGSVPH